MIRANFTLGPVGQQATPLTAGTSCIALDERVRH